MNSVNFGAITIYKGHPRDVNAAIEKRYLAPKGVLTTEFAFAKHGQDGILLSGKDVKQFYKDLGATCQDEVNDIRVSLSVSSGAEELVRQYVARHPKRDISGNPVKIKELPLGSYAPEEKAR